MISWIKGELIDLWQTNKKFFILINCQGVGYEIQILEYIFIKLKTKQISHQNLTFWLKHIKKEDSDSLFGFISKDQKDFFIEIINIKGVGSQIGMSLLNKFSIKEIINAINLKDKKLISSVQGIGQKMTERIILEFKSNLVTNSTTQTEMDSPSSSELIDNIEINSMLKDIDLTLQSLNYPRKEINNVLPILIKDIEKNENLTHKKKNISFENLLKLAMNNLDNNTK